MDDGGNSNGHNDDDDDNDNETILKCQGNFCYEKAVKSR